MAKEEPFISIIIPTRLRHRQLSGCLNALTRLEYSRDRFEVIVVDDGGDTTPTLLADYREQLDVTLIKQAHAGPAAARNKGATQARGELITFTDDDCAPDAGWLRAIAARSRATPGSAIGGRTVNALPENSFSTASQALIDYLYSYYNVDSERAAFFTSNNLTLPRARFHDLGGFDENFTGAAGEDRELCDRWRNAGYRMVYASDAVVYHSHAMTLSTFWWQHFGYGRSAVRFHQSRARRGQGARQLEPLSFYLNLLRYPYAGSGHGQPVWLLSLLLTVSQLANAAGYFYERADIISTPNGVRRENTLARHD